MKRTNNQAISKDSNVDMGMDGGVSSIVKPSNLSRFNQAFGAGAHTKPSSIMRSFGSQSKAVIDGPSSKRVSMGNHGF